MIDKYLAPAGWLILAYIAFATLLPIALRPQISDASIERFFAFAVIGCVFGLAYSRRLWHGRTSDALVKVAGGITGIMLSALITRWLSRKQAHFRLQSGAYCLTPLAKDRP
jgi:hypothetical protein